MRVPNQKSGKEFSVVSASGHHGDWFREGGFDVSRPGFVGRVADVLIARVHRFVTYTRGFSRGPDEEHLTRVPWLSTDHIHSHKMAPWDWKHLKNQGYNGPTIGNLPLHSPLDHLIAIHFVGFA